MSLPPTLDRAAREIPASSAHLESAVVGATVFDGLVLRYGAFARR